MPFHSMCLFSYIGDCITDRRDKQNSCKACHYNKLAEINPDIWSIPDLLTEAGIGVSFILIIIGNTLES